MTRANLKVDAREAKEKMTVRQASYLRTLTAQAGEEFVEELTKEEASKEISRLKARKPVS